MNGSGDNSDPFPSIPPFVQGIRQRLLFLVESTDLPLPVAWCLALAESCRHAVDGAELLGMVSEALGEPAAFPVTLRDRFMQGLLAEDWNPDQDLMQATSTTKRSNDDATYPPSASRSTTPISPMDDFLCLRRMALSIFYASRKIQRLPLETSRHLGSSILRTACHEELMHLFLTSLEHSVTLDESARKKIFNDVLERRYYRLLWPDRFDCEGILQEDSNALQSSSAPPLRDHDGIHVTDDSGNRNQEHVAPSSLPSSASVGEVWIDERTQDCSICLGPVQFPVTLPCQHVFCCDCILDWAHESTANAASRRSRRDHSRARRSRPKQQVPCPVCRQLTLIIAT